MLISGTFLNNSLYGVLCSLKEPNNRLASWEHCYREFSRIKNNASQDTINTMTLHLCFYLASFGMYRGSSFLLSKDYLFLKPIVEWLIQYKPVVYSHDFDSAFSPDGINKSLLMINELENVFKKMGIKQKNLRILSSKILLGTWCTTPAFDSYFLESAEKFGFGKKTFSDRNIRLIMNSIYQNRESFLKNIQNFNKIYKKNIYTDVRIVDLLMWKSNF